MIKHKYSISIVLILIILGVLYLLDTIQISGNELIFVWSMNITVSSIGNKLMSSYIIIISIIIVFLLFSYYMLKGD